MAYYQRNHQSREPGHQGNVQYGPGGGRRRRGEFYCSGNEIRSHSNSGQQYNSGPNEDFHDPLPPQERGRSHNASQGANFGRPTSGHRNPSPKTRNKSPYGRGMKRDCYGPTGPPNPMMFTDSRQFYCDQSQRSYYSNSSQGSGGGRHRDSNSDFHLSKKLSFLLRHGAEKEGFTLMPGGFLFVEDVLKLPSLQDFRIDDVERVVANNDKQRFALKRNPENKRLMIRANQGHTMEVDDLDLKPITSANEVDQVIHGTYWKSWEIIQKTGLSRMGRNHIHFAAGEPGENGVISGMRSSCEVIIMLDMKKALADGLKFFRSANNVILSAGDERGIIYPAYFDTVVQRYPRRMLQFDKNITKTNVQETAPKSKKKNKKTKKRGREDESEEGKKNTGQEKKEKKENQPEIDVDISDMFIEKKDTSEDTTEYLHEEKEKVDTPIVDENPSQPIVPYSDDEWSETNSEVKVEEEYEVTEISDSPESRSAVERICETKSAVAISCYGDKLGEEEGSISHILCVDRKDCFLFCVGENKSLITDGKLHDFLTSKEFPKVFHGCGNASQTLFKQFEILLDGTNIYDTKVVYDLMVEAGEGNITDFEKVKFCPQTWPTDFPSTTLESQKIDERDRCVSILKAYELMVKVDGMEKKYKKEIFEEANRLIGKENIKAFREARKVKAKEAKSQSEPPPKKSGKKKNKK
ncbi:uncharacterized protein LOC132557400 [Ylistrum balloti]|uniref:uncharacterized protein LOC132557400 n=1 Tax=Ylistrum balloti TaxID=509963 RepID=UPI002905F090|nr:uncharacterized protein LOC132557400 [Ylistrum balloti]XP_060077882.1 uncharacterized protein LOC132557400 [Ylistrum balloti]